MIAKYRKKPVEIEAVRFLGFNQSEVVGWVVNNGGTASFHEAGEKVPGPGRGITTLPEYIAIDTLEGTMKAFVGDYVIKGVQDEFYPCKPDIFHSTYDKLTEEQTS